MNLLWEVERHLRATGTPATRFGREAMNDPGFVRTLRNGRELRARTAAKLRAYLAKVSA